MRTGSPAAIGHPGDLGVRAVAVRMNEITGVVQRSSSSTALGHQGPVGGSRVALAGCSAKATRPPRDQVAGGLVAGHEQLDQEHGQLGVGQLVAVDVGLGQCR